MITINVPIAPVAWQRVKRGGNGQTYVPAKTANFKSALAYHLASNGAERHLSGALAVWIDFHIVPPKRGPNKLPCVRPDIDNFVKGVLDAANGILWKDDGQIVELHTRKLYDWTTRKGSIRITVAELKDNP